MQILSLNINGFVGTKNKRNYSGDTNKNGNVVSVFAKIFSNCDPDIIILSEFNVNSEAGKYAMGILNSKGYHAIYPNVGKSIGRRITSIVLVFSKSQGQSCESSGPVSLKWNEVICGEYTIVGVHVPFSASRHQYERKRAEKYWDAMVKHFEEHQSERVIYIGDMNVYKSGTYGMKQLETLLKKGAKDAWIERTGLKHNDIKGFTYKKSTRADYVIMSENAYDVLVSIENMQGFYNEKLSDHSGILIDLESYYK